MLKKSLILAFISTFTSGCATNYIEPSSGELATLFMPAKESSWKFLGGFSAATVTFAIKGEDGCGRIYKQLPPAEDGGEEVSVAIPANNDIFISFAANNGNTACHVAGSFEALPDKKYRVVNLGGGYSCMVGVVEITDDGKSIRQPMERAYPDTFSGTKICEKR